MRRRKYWATSALASVMILIAAWIAAGPDPTEASGTRQAEALALLTARIIRGSVHPCPGDCGTRVRETLEGRLVSDDYFDYSDLATSYPEVRGTLQGMVAWDLGETLEGVTLIVGDFHAEPDVLRMELERILPGCEIDDDSESDAVVDAEDGAVDSTREWDC